MSTLAQEVLHLREKVQEANDLLTKSEQGILNYYLYYHI